MGGLKILGQLSPDLATATADFLIGMQAPEGGLRANTRIPIADLLSSFTGLFTLFDLGEHQRLQLELLTQFAGQLAASDGGFRGALWDIDSDVEYTFYGLGTLALLANAGHTDDFQTAS